MRRRKEKCLSVSSRLRLAPSSETFSDSFMKSLLLITTRLIIPGLFARAASAEQEKACVAKYKDALEANDSATLQSVLHTTGAEPMIDRFHKMLQAGVPCHQDS